MQKKINFFLIILIILFLLICFTYFSPLYKIKIQTIDSYSPDRKIEVYFINKKIKFDKIKYLDDTILCYGKNPTISYIDIKDEKKLKVVLNSGIEIIAEVN